MDISTATYSEIANKLENNDYIYVAGGNTFFLLQEMNRSGAGNIIKTQINTGKLFIDKSAGAILLAPNIEYSKDTDNPLAAPQLKIFETLNVINFYPVPHYKNDLLKESVEIVISKYSTELPLVPFSNSQAILVIGKEKQLISKKSKGKLPVGRIVIWLQFQLPNNCMSQQLPILYNSWAFFHTACRTSSSVMPLIWASAVIT